MTNKPIPAICDAETGCGKPFNITKFRTRLVKGGNEKNYFRCPHCKQEYVTYYASKETKRLQAEMRKLHREAYDTGSTMTAAGIQFKEAELKSKIKQSMDEARLVSTS